MNIVKCLRPVSALVKNNAYILNSKLYTNNFVFLPNIVYSRLLSCTSVFSKIISIKNNDDFLTKVMHSDKPVIVNFHAEWCEPCHILTPKMEELIGPKENIYLAVVDVENNAELVHTFEVKAVPAVIAVRDGLVVDKFIGLVDANMIDKLIAKLDDL